MADEVRVDVKDDGVGFDTGARTPGFGLAGMRERVYLADGVFEILPGDHGTRLRARLPLAAAGDVAAGADQAMP